MKKHGVRKAFQSMSNGQLMDYLTIQLILRQSAIMLQASFDGDLFKVAVNYANQNVMTAEKMVLARGLSVELAHNLVMDVFLAGAPDLTPENVVDTSEELEGLQGGSDEIVGEPVETIEQTVFGISHDGPYETWQSGIHDPNAVPFPKLSIVDGERSGAEI